MVVLGVNLGRPRNKPGFVKIGNVKIGIVSLGCGWVTLRSSVRDQGKVLLIVIYV